MSFLVPVLFFSSPVIVAKCLVTLLLNFILAPEICCILGSIDFWPCNYCYQCCLHFQGNVICAFITLPLLHSDHVLTNLQRLTLSHQLLAARLA